MHTLLGAFQVDEIEDIPPPLEEQRDSHKLALYDWKEGCLHVFAYGGWGPTLMRVSLDSNMHQSGYWTRMAHFWPNADEGPYPTDDIVPAGLWMRGPQTFLLATGSDGEAYYWFRDLSQNIFEFDLQRFPKSDHIDQLWVSPSLAHVEVHSTITGARWQNIAYSGWTRYENEFALTKLKLAKAKRIRETSSGHQLSLF